MAKVISIALSVYIAILACFPCSDGDVCVDDVKIGAVSINTADHAHDESEVDLCSPFCICTCCHAAVQQPQYLSFTFEAPKHNVVSTSIKPHAVPSVVHSIWQPPRLA